MERVAFLGMSGMIVMFFHHCSADSLCGHSVVLSSFSPSQYLIRLLHPLRVSTSRNKMAHCLCSCFAAIKGVCTAYCTKRS
jgi:hypothetical protein